MNKKTRSLINTRYEAQKIYYQRKEIKRKDKELDRLNKCFIYLEKYFSKRQQYEDAEIVRQLKEANIEWLNQGIDYLQMEVKMNKIND